MWEVPRSSNRRIGERVAVDPIPVALVLPNERKGLLRRPVEIEGLVLDVSVSGLAIGCPKVPKLANRTVATLQVQGSVSTVRVVRSSLTADGRGIVYGVSFVRLDPRLQDELYAVLGRGRPTAELWFTAR
jgi:hypothetical protein